MTYIIGLLVLAVLLVALGVFYVIRKRKKRRTQETVPEPLVTPQDEAEEPLNHTTPAEATRGRVKAVAPEKTIEASLGYKPPPVIQLGQRKLIRFDEIEEEEEDLGEHGEWLLQTLSFYRSMGFFAQYEEETDRQLAQRLQEMQEAEWGQGFYFEDPYYAQLEVLIHDKERIWFEDIEAGVALGKQVYAKTIQALAHISRGYFEPQDIDEIWAGEKGPIHVEFTHLGQRYRMGLEYRNGWMDIWGLILQLNQVVVSRGYQFEIVTFDQNAFVTLLTPREKRSLKQERGLDFFKPFDMLEWKKHYAK